MGVAQEEENLCPICNEEKEKSKHRVHCGRVYGVWAKVAKLWDLNFVGDRNVVTTFDVLFDVLPKGEKLRLWQMACITLVWSI